MLANARKDHSSPLEDGAPGGTQQSFILGGSAPSSNPVPFYYHFWHKKVPV